MAEYPDSRLPWRDGTPDQHGSAPLAALALRSVHDGLLLLAAAVVSIVTTLAIIFSLLRETISFFGDVPIGDFLFGTKWTPLLGGDQQSFGVIPLVWGTLYLTGIGLLVAVPVGLLCAIYLSEFAPRRVRKAVKPILEILAGVPTIVFGYFALTFFTPDVLRDAARHRRQPVQRADAPASSSASW